MELDEFRKSAETHFNATFLVTGTHPLLSLVTLESLSTGRRYPVTDASLSRSIPDGGGIIGARLVKVGGTWHFPSNPAFFYPVIPTDRMVDMLRENADPEEEFIDLVGIRYGRKNHGDAGRSEMAVIPQSAEEQQMLLEELEGRYSALVESKRLQVTWNDIVDAIQTEDGEIMPTDLLRDLFANSKGEIDVSDMEAL